MVFDSKIIELSLQAEKELEGVFREFDRISFVNTGKVMAAFAENRVAEAMFQSTSGYGYDDRGRDTLDKIYPHPVLL